MLLDYSQNHWLITHHLRYISLVKRIKKGDMVIHHDP